MFAGFVLFFSRLSVRIIRLDTVQVFYILPRCKIPGLKNDTWDDPPYDVNYFIPPSNNYPYDRCHLYDRGNNTVNTNTSKPTNNTEVKCKEWVYATSTFESTFTKQVSLFIAILICPIEWFYSQRTVRFYTLIIDIR